MSSTPTPEPDGLPSASVYASTLRDVASAAAALTPAELRQLDGESE